MKELRVIFGSLFWSFSLIRIICLLIVFLFSNIVFAKSNTLELSDQALLIPGKSMQILLDHERKLSFEDILHNRTGELEWQFSPKVTPSYGYSRTALWIRFSLKNITRLDQERLLQIGHPYQDSIALFQKKNGQWQEILVGDHFPFDKRPVNHREYLLPISVKSQSTQQYYIRVQTEGTLNVPVKIWQKEHFFDRDANFQIVIGLNYGVLIVMFLYNLFVYFSIKDKSYLHYILYIFNLLFFQMALYGHSFQYLWPNWPNWANWNVPIFLNLILVFMVLFAIRILGIKNRFRWLYYLLLTIIYLSFAMSFIVFYSYSIAMRITAYFSILILFILLFTGIILTLRQNRTARFYLAAWFCMLTGALIYGMQNALGVLPDNFFTNHAHQFGASIEAIIFSLALADRINSLQKEKKENQSMVLSNLQKSDVLKDQLIKSMSGDLYHPVNSLYYASKALQGDLLANTRRKIYRKVYEVSAALKAIVKNMLLVSRIESNAVELHIQALDISDLIDDFKRELRALDFPNKWNVRFSGDRHTYCDPMVLRSILWELVTNAILHNSDQIVTVQINHHLAEGESLLSICDNGRGVPESELIRISQKFYRIEKESDDKYFMGQGLYIVRRLVSLLKGQFILRSPAESGLQVEIRMPINSNNPQGLEA